MVAMLHDVRPATIRLRIASVVTIVGLLLTACAGAGEPTTAGRGIATTPGATGTPAASDRAPASRPVATGSPSAVAVLDQPWATATLTNVKTGQPFRIADLVASGKTVFLETMAIWCTKCRAQQFEAVAAFVSLDPLRTEWVAIDVEASETAEALTSYSEQNRFPFTYAIADAGFARALVAEFGEVVLSPPSVNIIVIGSDGRITQLRGHKSADELKRLASEHGA